MVDLVKINHMNGECHVDIEYVSIIGYPTSVRKNKVRIFRPSITVVTHINMIVKIDGSECNFNFINLNEALSAFNALMEAKKAEISYTN